VNGRTRLRGLMIAACCLVPGPSAQGVVVFEKGQPQPTVGHLVRQNEQSIVIRQLLPDGGSVTREIFRSQIEDLLIAVSDQRLAQLRPDDPGAYRDYAEELSIKRRDPEALATSLRLYLIAADLDPQRLGRSCLLGMVALARDPQEERRFRAMAFLLDPNQDRNILRVAPATPDAGDPTARAGLLKVVQAMRRGQRRLAMQILDRAPVRTELTRYRDLLTLEQLLAVEAEIPPDTLYKLLMLEWLLTRPGDEVCTEGRLAWSQLADRQQLEPIVPLSLQTLTEFDPRECLYRDGRWLRPEQLR
jgi:hypothetical protein